ncbi:MAG: hypothetical protein WA418_27760 [Bradyrhizobium sp.]
MTQDIAVAGTGDDMSLRGTIERPDKAALGSVADVKQQLAAAFPGVEFTYNAEQTVQAKAACQNMPLPLRIWLFLFGVDGRYPNHTGEFTSDRGGIVQFYFEAGEPVRRISATSYGRTSGLDDNFQELARRTGWIVRYPRF